MQELELSGGLCAPLPSPPNKGLPTEGPHEDKHPPVQEQIRRQRKKDGKVPGYYGEDERQDFGDVEGHDFHGNQYTGSRGGQDHTVSGTTVRGETHNRILTAKMLEGTTQAVGAEHWATDDNLSPFSLLNHNDRSMAKAEIVEEAGKDIAEAAKNDPEVKAEFEAWANERNTGQNMDVWKWAAPGETISETAERTGRLDDLVDRYGEFKAQQYVDSWANSAADEAYISLALQETAASVLDAHSDSFDKYVGDLDELPSHGFHEDGLPETARETIDEALSENGASMRAFVQGEYDRTQAYLKEQGITELSLFRGVSFGKDDPPSPFHEDGVYDIDMNPASSWTVDKSIAEDFAGSGGGGYAEDPTANNFLLIATVPAEDVISTARTGQGALIEGEVIIRNQSDAQAYVQRTQPETYPENQHEPLPTGYSEMK